MKKQFTCTTCDDEVEEEAHIVQYIINGKTEFIEICQQCSDILEDLRKSK